MRLRADQEIAGRPAMQVRVLLRRFNQEFWTVRTAAKVLKIPQEQARRLVYSLGRLGYVEVVRQRRPGTWRNTMAANALANATAARPISRPDAELLLKELLIRVEIINGDPSSLYRVGKVVIFGSYLKNQEWVGDIDVAIRLDRRAEYSEDCAEALLARAAAAENGGRRFRGFLERLAWPETEVRRYLRGSRRGLTLHDWTREEPWLRHASHKVLLEDRTFAAEVKSVGSEYPKRRVRTGHSASEHGLTADVMLKR